MVTAATTIRAAAKKRPMNTSSRLAIGLNATARIAAIANGIRMSLAR